MSAEASNVAVIDPPRRGQAIQVYDPIPVLDTARFEHMQRIAATMARMTLTPLSLVAEKKGNGNDARWEALPLEVAIANCFLVVNFAVRANMDPFAVAQCASVVHGRLMWEGKFIAALLEQKLGVRLHYKVEGSGADMRITVSGKFPDEAEPRSITGSVKDWKTGQWSAEGFHRMLHYRGAREWARLYAPSVMLGVYTDDEMGMLEHRTERSTREPPPPPALPKREPPPPPPATRKEPPAPPASGRSSVPYAEMAKTNNEAEDASYVDLAGDMTVTDKRDPDTVVEDLRQDMSAVENADQFDKVDAAYRDAITALPPEHKAEALRIRAEHMERVG